jgi:hypothetical protein
MQHIGIRRLNICLKILPHNKKILVFGAYLILRVI